VVLPRTPRLDPLRHQRDPPPHDYPLLALVAAAGPDERTGGPERGSVLTIRGPRHLMASGHLGHTPVLTQPTASAIACRSRTVVRPRGGTAGTASVNVRRGQSIVRHRHRRLCHNSFDVAGP
jgi:hypothetical protein